MDRKFNLQKAFQKVIYKEVNDAYKTFFDYRSCQLTCKCDKKKVLVTKLPV